MDAGMLAALTLLLGIALGTLLATATYRVELRRQARWLDERDPASNARMTVNAAAPGLKAIACAVNAELDRAAEDRVAAMRRAQAFQRDLSALSHDIRTPLTGAKGYLQLAGEEPDTAARARHLDAAVQRIDATTALLDQLFAYSKASDPDLRLEMRPVSLKPLVEGVLLGQYPAFAERGWEPVVKFDDAKATATGDASALTRIVENLVVNELRHGCGAPEIQQEGRTLTFRNAVEHPETLDPTRLFERFYQADASRSAAGSGLGLATASKLARAMGMRLSAALEGDVLAITLAW